MAFMILGIGFALLPLLLRLALKLRLGLPLLYSLLIPSSTDGIRPTPESIDKAITNTTEER